MDSVIFCGFKYKFCNIKNIPLIKFSFIHISLITYTVLSTESHTLVRGLLNWHKFDTFEFYKQFYILKQYGRELLDYEENGVLWAQQL